MKLTKASDVFKHNDSNIWSRPMQSAQNAVENENMAPGRRFIHCY